MGVAGATGAYLSDTESSPGNNFSSGTIDLADNSESWMQTVIFTDMRPGQTIRKWFVLKNIGTLDIGSIRLSAANVNDPDNLLSQIKVSLIGQADGYPNAYYSPDWTGGATIMPFLSGNGVNILGSYYYSSGTPATILSPNSRDTVIMDFTLPQTIGSQWQGKSANLDFKFEAEQVH